MYTAPDYPQGVCHIRKAAELPTAVQCAACAVIQAANPQCAGVKGQGPLRSLGGPRGPFSHVREWPPFPCSAKGAATPPRDARKRGPRPYASSASSCSVSAMEMTLSPYSLKRMTITPCVALPVVRIASTGVRMRIPARVTSSRSSLPSTTLTPTMPPVFSVTM